MSVYSEEPKYEMVKRHIRSLLRQDIVKFGERLPSEHELMDQFNVSRNTIRQALADLTSDGLIFREQGKGTFSKYTPENRNEKKIVAVMTTYISDYIFPDIIFGIEEVLSAEGFSMLLANTNNNKDKETRILKNILQHDVVGLIGEPTLSAQENINWPLFNELRQKNIQLVFLNACYPDIVSACVQMDDEKAGFMATEYLLQLGHKQIAGIFKRDDIQGMKRKAGFLTAIEHYGIHQAPDLLVEYETCNEYFQPYKLARSLILQKNRPTAVVCYNDNIALMVIQAAKDCGLNIPGDISIIGFDDSKKAVETDVKLTTIVHPKAEMGRRAAALMIDLLDHPDAAAQYIYQPELIIRNSCQRLSTSVNDK